MKHKSSDFLALTLLYLKNADFWVFLQSFGKNIWNEASKLGAMNFQLSLKLNVQSWLMNLNLLDFPALTLLHVR